MLKIEDLIKIKDELSPALLGPGTKLTELAGGSNGLLAGNIIGVGVGPKEVAGKLTNDVAIKFLVRVKLPPSQCGDFSIEKLIPALHHDAKLEPAQIDVLETGPIGSLAGLPGPINQLTIGADVAMAGRTLHGTICGFVTRTGRHPYLLSCGHVLDGRKGLFRCVSSRDAVVADIAHPDDECTILPGVGLPNPANVDAAIARLRKHVDPNYQLPGGLGFLDRPIPVAAYSGMSVKKAGKTLRDGTVSTINVDVQVDYPSQTSIIKNQILVRSSNREVFAEAGDSGAMVLTGVNGTRWAPVGMVIAAGDPATLLPRVPGTYLPSRIGVVSPLQAILDELDVELVIN